MIGVVFWKGPVPTVPTDLPLECQPWEKYSSSCLSLQIFWWQSQQKLFTEMSCSSMLVYPLSECEMQLVILPENKFDIMLILKCECFLCFFFTVVTYWRMWIIATIGASTMHEDRVKRFSWDPWKIYNFLFSNALVPACPVSLHPSDCLEFKMTTTHPVSCSLAEVKKSCWQERGQLRVIEKNACATNKQTGQ